MDTPNTLPGNFNFNVANSQPSGYAPNTLPANFNFGTPPITTQQQNQPEETFGAGIVGGKMQSGREFTQQPYVQQVAQAFVQTAPKDVLDFLKFIPQAFSRLGVGGIQGLSQIGNTVGKMVGMNTGLEANSDINVPGVGNVRSLQNTAQDALDKGTNNTPSALETNLVNKLPESSTEGLKNDLTYFHGNQPFGFHAFVAPILKLAMDGSISENALKNVVDIGSKIFGDAPAESLLTGDFSQGKSGLIQKVPEAIQNGIYNIKGGITDKMTQNAIDDWGKPASTNAAGYKKATQIYNNAMDNGNNIGETLTNNGIKLSDNVTGGKYDTLETADELRQDAGKTSSDLLRPALEKANPSVQATPVENIIDDAKSSVEDSKFLTQEQKDNLIGKLEDSQAALQKQYPDGMQLTDLHDEKILRDANAKYSPIGDPVVNAEAQKNKVLADVLRNTLEEKAPDNIPVKEFNAELQKQYQAANYLESLNTKKVPISILGKIANTGGKVAGAVVGSHLGGGVLGGVGGYHIGGMVENMLSSIPAQFRDSLLNNLQETNPEAFQAVSDALGQMTEEQAGRLALPAPGEGTSPINLPEPGVLKGQENIKEPSTTSPILENPKTAFTAYHGEGSHVQSETGNVFGNGFYVSRTSSEASVFGPSLSSGIIDLKPSDIYNVKTQEDLTKLYETVIKKYPDLSIGDAIPKYVKSLGYKAIEGKQFMDGINIFDKANLK